jgi:tellurite resistance protein TerC
MDRVRADGLRAVRRIVVAVVGATILAVGLALLVLPGPAFLVIPIGLAVLALEFEWARRLLRRARAAWPPPDRKDGG